MVRSHRFCCCLPVRLGVFILSFWQALFCGVSAAFLWYILLKNRLTETQKITVICVGVLMTILTFSTFLGFVGSITRRIGFVRLYSRTLKWLLAINVVLGIAAIVLAFVADRQTIVDICTGGSTDSDVVRECGRTSTKVYRYSLLVMIVVQWIVQLYECFIVSSYVNQLQEEKEEKWRLSSMKNYTQVSGRDSMDAFVVPEVHYPFADQDHSRGYSSKV